MQNIDSSAGTRFEVGTNADLHSSSPHNAKPNVSSSLSQLVEDMLATAELFQDECHALTKEIIAQNPKCTVQDATNVWMFKKLAEFEVRLRLLEFVVQP